MGKPYEKKFIKEVLSFVAHHPKWTHKRIIERFKISTPAFYDWMKKYPEFLESKSRKKPAASPFTKYVILAKRIGEGIAVYRPKTTDPKRLTEELQEWRDRSDFAELYCCVNSQLTKEFKLLDHIKQVFGKSEDK